MLTGQAFPGGLQNGILNKILQSQREPIETICQGLDPEVVRILNQALERDPEKRYQDLTVMRKDLQRLRLRLESATDATVLASPAEINNILTDARPPTTPSPSHAPTTTWPIGSARHTPCSVTQT